MSYLSRKLILSLHCEATIRQEARCLLKTFFQPLNQASSWHVGTICLESLSRFSLLNKEERYFILKTILNVLVYSNEALTAHLEMSRSKGSNVVTGLSAYVTKTTAFHLEVFAPEPSPTQERWACCMSHKMGL